MRNFNVIISVVIALVVILGIFWFAGGGFPQEANIPNSLDGIKETEDTKTSESKRIKNDALALAVHPDAGEYVVDPKGMSLYTTSRECTNECLSVWPPYTTDRQVSDGRLSTVFREESGAYQYTWDGDALYYYEEDTAPGDILGDGVGGVWDLARP